MSPSSRRPDATSAGSDPSTRVARLVLVHRRKRAFGDHTFEGEFRVVACAAYRECSAASR